MYTFIYIMYAPSRGGSSRHWKVCPHLRTYPAIQLSLQALRTPSRCAMGQGSQQLLGNAVTPCTDSLVLNICAAQFKLEEVTPGTHGLPRMQQIVGPSVNQEAEGLMNTTTDDE